MWNWLQEGAAAAYIAQLKKRQTLFTRCLLISAVEDQRQDWSDSQRGLSRMMLLTISLLPIITPSVKAKGA